MKRQLMEQIFRKTLSVPFASAAETGPEWEREAAGSCRLQRTATCWKKGTHCKESIDERSNPRPCEGGFDF